MTAHRNILARHESLPHDLFGHQQEAEQPVKTTSRQAQLGQYLTPESVSGFMAKLFPPLPSNVRLLDAGAGMGALTSAFVTRWQSEYSQGTLAAHLYEKDENVLPGLQAFATNLSELPGLTANVIAGDFIEQAATMLRLRKGPRYTHAILNPPYKKINTASQHRLLLRAAGLETVNLYSGFVGLAIALMEKGGEVVVIIPRSFCNGPYYQPFRRFLFERTAIRRIHLFESRNTAFKKDGVLQENIILHLTCGAKQSHVAVSTSTDDTFEDYNEHVHPFSNIVMPGDADQFIHIPTNSNKSILRSAAFGFRLKDLGLAVSTGPVVDFRLKEYLRDNPGPDTVPLLYPGHFAGEKLEWPKPGFKKPNAICQTPATAKWLMTNGFYAIVRRFSSKEERRRIVASVVDPSLLPAKFIGFENHLNVIHQDKRSLDAQTARGVALYLNSTMIDEHFRIFNGHTQVNATDLRSLPFPSHAALVALGEWAAENPCPSQESIDRQVAALA